MIGLLTGTIFGNRNNPLIVEVGGVGYLVHVVNRFTSQISKNKKVTLYIYTQVRDEAIDLFGFETEEELNLFKLLLTVSGIGPRTALAVLDHGVASIEKAVWESDVDFFTAIPRLGKKNAQKIIIELKSKLGSIKDLDLTAENTGETRELIEALVSMGFDKNEIRESLKHLEPEDSTLELKLKRLLRYFGKSV